VVCPLVCIPFSIDELRNLPIREALFEAYNFEIAADVGGRETRHLESLMGHYEIPDATHITAFLSCRGASHIEESQVVIKKRATPSGGVSLGSD
jgi:hypothetical protein